MIVLTLLITFTACKKQQELLEEKNISKQFTPTTVEDVQSLLDNTPVMSSFAPATDMLADNYYIDSAAWKGLSSINQLLYVWAGDPYQGQGDIEEWNQPYEQVLYANIALDALNNTIAPGNNPAQWNNLKGSALFIRALAHFNVALLFAKPYDDQTAGADLGIPLRLSPDVTTRSYRSTMSVTYKQIIADAREAAAALTATVDPDNPNRPNKPAACALLSRIYLSMRQYKEAGDWADSCLRLYNKLLNYNDVSTTATFPFTGNPEILYDGKVPNTKLLLALVGRTTFIDSALYKLYVTNDLRSQLYYSLNNGKPLIRSSYSNTIYPFAGLATDEVYVTLAECYARNNETAKAISIMDTFLINRYSKGVYTPLPTTLGNGLLQYILEERRKELPFRGTRWMDLRRLNKEGADITLTRKINNNTYTLPSGDLRWVLPIPPDVIALTGMEQNPR